MNYSKYILALLVLSASFAQAAEWLVLKGEERTDDRFAEIRRNAEVFLAQKQKEMSDNGYIEATRAQLGVEAAVLSKADEYRPGPTALGPLSFAPLTFDNGPLKQAQYVGAYDPLGGSSGNTDISHITHVLDHKKLGRIFVDEYSFATDASNSRYVITAPSNNIYISGYPAGFIAVRDGNNYDSGYSEIEFVTDQKHIYVKAFKPMTVNSADYDLLVKIANSLAL